MEYVRFFVRRVDGRWTFGRADKPFLSFESKAKAVARARAFLAKMEFATLVIEDEAFDRGPTARRARVGRPPAGTSGSSPSSKS